MTQRFGLHVQASLGEENIARWSAPLRAQVVLWTGLESWHNVAEHAPPRYGSRCGHGIAIRSSVGHIRLPARAPGWESLLDLALATSGSLRELLDVGNVVPRVSVEGLLKPQLVEVVGNEAC